MTEQADFWRSEFGDEYITRNASDALLSSNIAFFSKVLSKCESLPKTYLELGANIGMNFRALQILNKELEFTGVEINKAAASVLQESGARAICSSIEAFESAETYEFSFTKGVLIHLNPKSLPDTYKKLADSSSKWVLLCEYFSPYPTELPYRGHSGKLFKRDFGSEFEQSSPNFLRVSEGFVSSRSVFPQDDLNWWLFRRGQ